MPDSELLLYRSTDGVVRVQCRLEGDTVWLSQRQLAELYQLGVGTVNHPIKAIYSEGELSPEATLRRYRIVQDLGSRKITREVEHDSPPLRTIPTTAVHALRAGVGAVSHVQAPKTVGLGPPVSRRASATPQTSWRLGGLARDKRR